jgi:asparagine synthase (glutamine-hydrolysing)
MLSLDLRTRDLARPDWQQTPDGWRNGQSWVRGLCHPALEILWFREFDWIALIVQERQDYERGGRESDKVPSAALSVGAAQQLEASTAILSKSSRDFCLVELRDATRGPAEVRLATGEAGRAPLYLHGSSERLVVDWSVENVATLVQASLDQETSAHFLMGSRPYGRRTLFRGVAMLTERATAVWDCNAVTIRYPPAAPALAPRTLRAEADVIEAYRETIRSLLRNRLDQSSATELSGGADSAAAAICARDIVGPDFRSYGVTVPGLRGAEQRRRRSDLISCIGLVDFSVRAVLHPPLARFRAAPCRMPARATGEIYAEAFGAMLDRAASDGVRTLLTGHGGDELFMAHYMERGQEGVPEAAEVLTVDRPTPAYIPEWVRTIFATTLRSFDWAPRSVVPFSGLSALASQAPLFLERGIWPLAPFCAREALQLCRRLPWTWRRDKLPHRRLIELVGCRPDTARPRLSESFLELFDYAMLRTARPLLNELFRAPRVADLGLVEPKVLREEYARACDAQRMAPHERFYEIAVLELLERRLGGSAAAFAPWTIYPAFAG